MMTGPRVSTLRSSTRARSSVAHNSRRAPPPSPKHAARRFATMAWFISWKSLIMMWAGGPLMMVTACLAAYCYCTYPRKKKKPIIPR